MTLSSSLHARLEAKLLAIWGWVPDGAPSRMHCGVQQTYSLLCVHCRSCFTHKTATPTCPARALLLAFDSALPSTIDQADLSGEAAKEQ